MCAKVMFTKNSFEGKFVNGTTGTIVGFRADDVPIVETRAGKRIAAEQASWSVEIESETLATVTQVPLRLAWAITVHKSQGMSLDAAIIDLGLAFEYGQGYVALSRVRTLAGLHLLGLNERALEVHPDILEKDIEFRVASEKELLKFCGRDHKENEKEQQEFIYACGGKKISEVASAVIKSYSLETLRAKNKNAYRKWTEEEDEDLARRHRAGEKIKEIAAALGRQKGAISSRIAKLGL